jgi:metallo-beta-lactamase family protein
MRKTFGLSGLRKARRLMANKKKEDLIKIQFCGAVNDEVTGSCTFVKVNRLNILIDFGMVQNNTLTYDELFKLNSKKLPVKLEDIDYVILSHFHADHLSNTGLLSDSRFKGKILCTHLTAKIMKIILTDSAYIMLKETTNINKKRKTNKVFPLYTKSDVENVMNFVQGYDFNKEIQLNDKVKLTFLPSGHVSGASMISIEYQESEYVKKRLLFTGDTSGINRSIPFTMKPNIEKMKFDFIQCESTYGNREHEDIDLEKQLENHIRETIFEKKGTLILPSFACGRCTNIIFLLKQLYDKHKEFNDIEIFLASPMSIEAHKTIGEESSFDFYDKEWLEHNDLFKWDKVRFIDSFDIVKERLINDTPKILISASGMAQAGYIKYIISKYLSNSKNKILFTGYQAIGTLGRKLLEGKQQTITLDGIQIPIKADIDILKNMSSHASCSELVDMLKTLEKKKISKICLNHGSDEAKESLREVLKKEFDCEVIIPKENQIVKI